uniref:Uncharacterized protein n=1 Tax=Rhizophora mucronata TaxID=61149 RepID=A0A2P2Q882_RHIMU
MIQTTKGPQQNIEENVRNKFHIGIKSVLISQLPNLQVNFINTQVTP